MMQIEQGSGDIAPARMITEPGHRVGSRGQAIKRNKASSKGKEAIIRQLCVHINASCIAAVPKTQHALLQVT